MSVETLVLLRNLLAGQMLNIGAADFPETAHAVTVALSELDTAIREAPTSPWTEGASSVL